MLDHRFDPALEKKILTLLRPVLRRGIVADPELFRRDVKKAIVLRDKATLIERAAEEPSQVRSMEAAQEHLRQLHLEFAELSAPERAELFRFLDTLLIPTLVYNAAETAIRRNACGCPRDPGGNSDQEGKSHPPYRRGSDCQGSGRPGGLAQFAQAEAHFRATLRPLLFRRWILIRPMAILAFIFRGDTGRFAAPSHSS